MGEKMEQTKEFIEEFERLNKQAISLHSALNMVTFIDFPILNIFLHDAFKNDEQCDQNKITFAKICAGEIELVEKKPKYVIYQVDDHTPNNYVHNYATNKRNGYFYHRGLWTSIESCLADITSPDRADELFDQDFAFAMRDTGKFEIEEVVE